MNPGYFLLIIIFSIILVIICSYELFNWIRSPFGWKKVIHDTGDYYFILEMKHGYDDRYTLKMAKIPIFLFTYDSDYTIFDTESTNIITMKQKFNDYIVKHLQSVEEKKNKKDKYRS